jgi:hypothetical protein
MRRMAFVPDDAIVAWHEVPGTAPPQKSRPVGYGVIRVGVHDTMIGVIRLKKCSAQFYKKYFRDECARSYRTLRDGSFVRSRVQSRQG